MSWSHLFGITLLIHFLNPTKLVTTVFKSVPRLHQTTVLCSPTFPWSLHWFLKQFLYCEEHSVFCDCFKNAVIAFTVTFCHYTMRSKTPFHALWSFNCSRTSILPALGFMLLLVATLGLVESKHLLIFALSLLESCTGFAIRICSETAYSCDKFANLAGWLDQNVITPPTRHKFLLLLLSDTGHTVHQRSSISSKAIPWPHWTDHPYLASCPCRISMFLKRLFLASR